MRTMPMIVAAVVASGLLAGCNGADGSKSRMSGVDWEADVTLTSHTVSISYRVENTGTRPLVVYNLGWISDPDNPDPRELTAEADDVEIVVDGDVVEFGLRIIHSCHGNPDGELTRNDTGKRADCGANAPDMGRVGATLLSTGEEVSDEFRFDADTLLADYPLDVARTKVDLSDKRLRFCVGVDRPNKPAKNGMYAPAAHETVLCTPPE